MPWGISAMRTERLRMLVSLHDAHPELVEDLAPLDRRLRAERMRMLATIGLVTLRSRQEPDAQPRAQPRLAEVALAPERPQAPTEVPADELSDRKARLLARLQG
jgi:hypothetical protein